MEAVYQGPAVFVPDGMNPAEAMVGLATKWELKAREAPTATLRKEYQRRAYEIRKAVDSTVFQVVPGGLLVPLYLDTHPRDDDNRQRE